MRASIWTSILSSVCWMHSSDSSLALLCTPPPSPALHFTPQRSGNLSVCVFVLVCACVQGREKKSWSVHGEKLSTSSTRGVVRSVVLKDSDSMSPTSPCCKQGLISAFIHGTSIEGCVCACAQWSVTSSQYIFYLCVLHVCVCALFPAPYCSTVQYLSYLCGEDQLEGDLRINAILKQNTTCQIFTPSLPHGDWIGWFSWQPWIYRPEPRGLELECCSLLNHIASFLGLP